MHSAFIENNGMWSLLSAPLRKKKHLNGDPVTRFERWSYIFELPKMQPLVKCIEAATPWKKADLGRKVELLYSFLSDKLHVRISRSEGVELNTGSVSPQAALALKCLCTEFHIKTTIRWSEEPISIQSIDE